jgi:hypothetical protein
MMLFSCKAVIHEAKTDAPTIFRSSGRYAAAGGWG